MLIRAAHTGAGGKSPAGVCAPVGGALLYHRLANIASPPYMAPNCGRGIGKPVWTILSGLRINGISTASPVKQAVWRPLLALPPAPRGTPLSSAISLRLRASSARRGAL